MKSNVLRKKNKLLALVLAAAMAFPSTPMSTVRAEEPEENAGVEAQAEPKDSGGGNNEEDNKYLFYYKAESMETMPEWLTGFTRVTQWGKEGALKFSEKPATVQLPKFDAISSGVVVFEMETLPASNDIQRAEFKNSVGDELFSIGSRKKGDDSGEFNFLKTETKITGINGSWPMNTWSHYRLEIYFDNTENEDSTKNLKYKVFSSHYSAKQGYDKNYQSDNWNKVAVKTQDALKGKTGAQENSTVTASIGTEGHPFDLGSITLYDGSNRWIGDFSLAHITNIELVEQPGAQVQNAAFNPGDAAVRLTYSTGVTENVNLADLTLGTDYTVSGFDSTEAGEKNITICYMGKDMEATVTVKGVKDINVTAPSQKYVEMGKTLDLSDMVVKAVFTDDTEEALNEGDYTVEGPDTSSTGKKTVTVKYGTFEKPFDVIVTIASATEGVKEVFAYNGSVDNVDELGLTISGSTTVALDGTGDAQMLKVTNGSATKSWGYNLETGVVKITTEMANDGNTKGALWRVLDKEGKPLIFIGQFGNTNLYDATSTTSDTSNKPYVYLQTGNQKYWIKLETEIDLDASNEKKVLQFVTKVYSKATLDGTYTQVATVTPETYQEGKLAAAVGDQTHFANANGCADANLSTFSVGAVEFTAKGNINAVFDNIYVGATQAVTLDSVAVKTPPTKDKYPLGATALDLTGLVLTETYSNNTTPDLDNLEEINEAYEFTGFDASSVGTKTITVTNKKDSNVKTTFDVTVENITIASIEVETEPTDKNYFVGDTELKLDGLVVKAVYSDDATKKVTLAASDYTVSTLDSATAGEKTITITSVAKNAAGEAVTATFKVNVKAPAVTGIEVTTKPKTTYLLNEAWDETGMVVTATYENGKKNPLAAGEYEVSGFNSSAEAASQTITVTYKADTTKTDTFNVTIVDASKFTPTEFAFDFNVTGSKTAEGWTGIFVNKDKNDKTQTKESYGYTAEKGYGLTTSENALQGRPAVGTLPNGDYASIAEDVYNDHILFANVNGSFDVDLPNGSYHVQVITATTETKGDTTSIKIQDSNDYTGSVGIGKTDLRFKVLEFSNVEVTDGKMIFKHGGSGNSRISGITISNISAPTGLRGEFDGKVKLNWGSSLGCVKYNVYRAAEDKTVKCVGTAEGTSFEDTTAEVLQTYTYYVRGVSEKGLETFASNQVEVLTKSDKPAPLTPTNPKITDRGPGFVKLGWDAMENATVYEIYAADKSAAGAADLTGFTRVASTADAFYQVEDPNHADKVYKILAAGGGGKSAPTAVVSSGEAVPGVPQNVKIAGMTAEATNLTWDAVTGAKYYEVYYIGKDAAAGKTGLEGYQLAGKTVTATYSASVANHTGCYFKVVAVGLEGRGEASDVAASDVAAPTVPANVTAAPEAEKTTITWDAVANASYYEIYWSDRNRTDLSGVEGYKMLGTSESTSYVLELPTHIERYFKVIAGGPGGKSAASDPAKADIVKKFNTQMEYLERGLVAIKVDGGVYLGWRLTGDEYEKGATYKLYRDGACIRTFTATENTSFLDTAGTLESKYAVSAVIEDVEGEKCAEVAVQEHQYMDVKLNQPEAYYDDKLTKDHIKSTYKGDKATHDIADARVDLSTGEYVYTPNDTYIGDVDGDGEYELIVKWDGMSRDNSQGGYTSPVIIDCYKLDGTQLWRIDLGINVRAGAHYTQPVVGDLDGDGRAEVMMRTSDGSVDGKGNIIGEAGKDYRNTGSGSKKGQVISGPEYLTLFDGETGEALDTIDYVPERGNVENDWKSASKGDSYGGRSERFLSGAAYLDGEHLSAIFARGYYGRAVVVAFTVENKKIKQIWKCDSKDTENKSLFGQGAHSFTVADVDGDGCQEIVYGSATIDHDGKLMYSLSDHEVTLPPLNGKNYIQGGHGDALRVTDMNLKNPGLEAFMVHEEHPNEANAEMHDAATGEYLFSIPGDDDIGRGASGDIDPNHEGGEFWFNGSNGAAYAADGTKLAKRPNSVNHMVWFDGTMGRDFLDGSYNKDTGLSSGFIAKWDYVNNQQVDILRDEGVEVNNTTKSNPCFQADIFGDWREEVGWRTDDNQHIRIYTSNEVQAFRLYSLMHDPTYRAQMACNGSAYNQSPDAGFYIGYDTDLIQIPIVSPQVTRVADYTEVNAAIADAKEFNPDEYVNYDDVQAAIDAVERGLPLEQQAAVDNMAKAIKDAIAALKKAADYTAVDAAIAKTEDIKAENYLNYDAVQAAVDAVVRKLPEDRQAEVDAFAKAIEDAIKALELKPADYTRVDAAIAAADGLNAEDYVSLDAVKAAVAAVDRSLKIDRQAEVDAMAQAIEDAIANLVKAPGKADYSKVNAAVLKAESLNAAYYVNYDAVQKALDAVVRGLREDQQAQVDAMAQAIEDAISRLEMKPADYAKVNAAVAKAESLNADDYESFDAVKAALAAVDRSLKIDRQADVDNMAKAIEDAIAVLVEKNLSRTDAVKANKGNLDEEIANSPELKAAANKVTGKPNATAADVMETMKQDIVNKVQAGGQEMVKDNVVVQEISVAVSRDGGKTWKPVTEADNDILSKGITLILPYPSGTNRDDFDFLFVTHLITMGPKAGTIQNEAFELTDEGLKVTVYSASPFAIGYAEKQDDDDDDEDDGPEETADNKSDNKTSTPGKTGDHMGSFVWMWTIVMAAAVAGIAAMFAVKARRKKETE